MHGDVRAYLSFDVGLWSFEVTHLATNRDSRVLQIIDEIADAAESDFKAAQDLACAKLETSKKHFDHIRGVVNKARFTREKRARLSWFVRGTNATWAANNALSFADLKDVTPNEWTVASTTNPFVLVPHLMELSSRPAQPLAVCAEFWEAQRPTKKIDFRTARYACAQIVLMRHRDLVCVPQHEASALATEAGFKWTLDFVDAFDITLGVLPRLRPAMSYVDETKWFRALSVTETEDVVSADAPLGFKYRFWMRDERLRLSHQIVVEDDMLAFAGNVESRDAIWGCIRTLRNFDFDAAPAREDVEPTQRRNVFGPIHIFGEGHLGREEEDQDDEEEEPDN